MTSREHPDAIFAAAIESAKARLGPLAALVKWIVAGVTEAEVPPHQSTFWHAPASFE